MIGFVNFFPVVVLFCVQLVVVVVVVVVFSLEYFPIFSVGFIDYWAVCWSIVLLKNF